MSMVPVPPGTNGIEHYMLVNQTRFNLTLPERQDIVQVTVLDDAFMKLGNEAMHLTLGNVVTGNQTLNGLYDFADQAAVPANPPAGWVRMYPRNGILYQLDENGLEQPLPGGGNVAGAVHEATNQTGTTITLPLTAGMAIAGVFGVYINGQALIETRDWTRVDTVITLTTALAGDDVHVEYFVDTLGNVIPPPIVDLLWVDDGTNLTPTTAGRGIATTGEIHAQGYTLLFGPADTSWIVMDANGTLSAVVPAGQSLNSSADLRAAGLISFGGGAGVLQHTAGWNELNTHTRIGAVAGGQADLWAKGSVYAESGSVLFGGAPGVATHSIQTGPAPGNAGNMAYIAGYTGEHHMSHIDGSWAVLRSGNLTVNGRIDATGDISAGGNVGANGGGVYISSDLSNYILGGNGTNMLYRTAIAHLFQDSAGTFNSVQAARFSAGAAFTYAFEAVNVAAASGQGYANTWVDASAREFKMNERALDDAIAIVTNAALGAIRYDMPTRVEASGSGNGNLAAASIPAAQSFAPTWAAPPTLSGSVTNLGSTFGFDITQSGTYHLEAALTFTGLVPTDALATIVVVTPGGAVTRVAEAPAKNGSVTISADVPVVAGQRVHAGVVTSSAAIELASGSFGCSAGTEVSAQAVETVTQIGFVADDWLPVVPEVVSVVNDRVMGMSYGRVVAIVFEALKQYIGTNDAAVQDILTRLTALEGATP